MRYFGFLMFAGLCACSDTRAGKACAQPYEQWAYAENRTGQTQTLEFSYLDSAADDLRRTFTASIPAGETLERKLRDYSKVIEGESTMSGPRNAYCSSTPIKSTAELSLTHSSFGQVKNCLVGEDSGLNYLVSNSAFCPEFTIQQGAAK